jgi:hypothetical protein
VDERPDEIENHIKSTQRELGSNLQELENKVKDATDWRVQFDRHPIALLGAAFTGGLLLSAGLGRRRRRGPDDLATHVHVPNFNMPNSRPVPERKSAPSDIWNSIKGALVAAAGTQISTVLGELVPGFREHQGTAARPVDLTERASTQPHAANGGHGEAHPSNGPSG